MLWLAAIALDMAFGGRKALGAIPLFETLVPTSIQYLKNKLERAGRSRRTHYWRGVFAAAVLLTLLLAIGALIHMFTFNNAATSAVAAVFLAKMLQLKPFWQSTQTQAAQADPGARRRAIEQTCDLFASFYVPAMILFLAGGFLLFLPFYSVWVGDRLMRTDAPHSAFLKPFAQVHSLLAWPGEMLATLFMALAVLFWPSTLWLQAMGAALKPRLPLRTWSSAVLAFSLNVSLRVQGSAADTWIEPADASAKPDAAKSRSALIVALLAFAMSLGFLLLLVITSAMG